MEEIKYPQLREAFGQSPGSTSHEVSLFSKASRARTWSLRWNSRAAQTKEFNVLDVVGCLSWMALLVVKCSNGSLHNNYCSLFTTSQN